MFDIGEFRASTCAGLTRRSFLKVGAALPFGWNLPKPVQGAEGTETPRAKTVLLVWLWGAPSHLDTFDPKPDAPVEYRGPFSTTATRTPGVRFTDLLPRLAARSDQYTLVRSHVSSQPGHPDGFTVALTGFHEKPGPVQPNFGSIVAKHRGPTSELSPFISVAQGKLRDSNRFCEGYGGSTLGKGYDPFMVSCAADGTVDLPALKLLKGLTPNRISDRKSLLDRLNRTRRQIDNAGIADWSRQSQRAYGLLTNPKALEAFDLTRESQATRDAYGYSTFGQSALMARRLVEAEVPYIQLNWSQTPESITPNYDFGWDTHLWNFELLIDRHCPVLDRALPVLLEELRERGLLDTTLVVVISEFGRTPKISIRAARDHWPQCYFSLWAGAGIEPGRIIGESDKLGEHPITSPITPLMVGTTIAELAGVNAQARAEMSVLDGGHVIDELL